MTTEPTAPSLIEIIKTISNAEENDVSFVVAATMNLYLETLRRVHGRVVIRPNDVGNIFRIVDTMLAAHVTESYSQEGRERKLTQGESDEVLVGGKVEAIRTDRIGRR